MSNTCGSQDPFVVMSNVLSVKVRVSIEVDDELELLERQVPENGYVRVSKGTGTPFNIKLKPRSVRCFLYI